MTRDDVERVRRPHGWAPDWSQESIETRRRTLAVFEERLVRLADPTKPVAWQVDRRLMGSALARVRWELDVKRSVPSRPHVLGRPDASRHRRGAAVAAALRRGARSGLRGALRVHPANARSGADRPRQRGCALHEARDRGPERDRPEGQGVDGRARAVRPSRRARPPPGRDGFWPSRRSSRSGRGSRRFSRRSETASPSAETATSSSFGTSRSSPTRRRSFSRWAGRSTTAR